MEIPFVEISPGNSKHAEEQVLAAESKGVPIIVVDRFGIRENRPMDRELSDLCALGTVWVMAGSRTTETAMDMLVLGAERVVVSSSLVASLDEVDGLLEESEGVMLAVEAEYGAFKEPLGDADLGGIEASMGRWSSAGMPGLILWMNSCEVPASFTRLASFPGLLYQRGGVPVSDRARRILPFNEWALVSGRG